MSFRLEFEHNGELQEIPFEQDSISVGREQSSDFVLDHPTVSRQHGVIVDEGGDDFRLVVLSQGGLTAIDGEPIEAEEVRLYDGTQITFGKYTVTFRSHRAPARPAGGASAGPAGAGGPAGPGQGQPGGAPADPAPEAAEDGGAGIESWDEIAADSGSDQKTGDSGQKKSGAAALKEARDQDEEETNPVLVGVGILAAVVMLAGGFLMGSDDGESNGSTEQPQQQEEMAPVEIEVDCHGESSCLRLAESHYERGVDLIDRRALETGNLFEGYRRLLMARESLEEAGIEEPPEEMSDLDDQLQSSRETLDEKYKQFQVRFHQAQQRGRHEEMADILEDVEEYFPDRTARENRWAREKRRAMKRNGNFPHAR